MDGSKVSGRARPQKGSAREARGARQGGRRAPPQQNPRLGMKRFWTKRWGWVDTALAVMLCLAAIGVVGAWLAALIIHVRSEAAAPADKGPPGAPFSTSGGSSLR